MTRDVTAWQATMARLDAEELTAKQPVESLRLTPPEIVDYTRSLPHLWADSGPDGRQALVAAVFAKLDVLGFERLEYELTPDAIDLGLDAALPPILELRSQIGGFGRGERAGNRPNQLIVRVAPGIPTRITIIGPARRLTNVINRSA